MTAGRWLAAVSAATYACLLVGVTFILWHQFGRLAGCQGFDEGVGCRLLHGAFFLFVYPAAAIGYPLLWVSGAVGSVSLLSSPVRPLAVSLAAALVAARSLVALAGYALDLARAGPPSFAHFYAALGLIACVLLLRMNRAGRWLGVAFLLVGLRAAFVVLTGNVAWTWVWVAHVALHLADAALLVYLLLPSTGRQFARARPPR